MSDKPKINKEEAKEAARKILWDHLLKEYPEGMKELELQYYEEGGSKFDKLATTTLSNIDKVVGEVVDNQQWLIDNPGQGRDSS